MPRLGYKKSRTGCLKCRQRRVKCDEKRPCSACVRHGVTCSLLTSPASDLSGQPSLSRASSTTSQSPQDSTQPAYSKRATSSPPGAIESISSLVLGDSQRQPNPSWITDLELMHHYTATACFSLPRAAEVSDLWQKTIVKLSFTNEPILHQVLALSAYHLAYQDPSRRHECTAVAAQHQSDAAQGLRTALLQVTPESCHAVFAAASLLIMSTFARLSIAQEEDAHHPALADMIEVLVLIRGMATILDAFDQTIKVGELSALFAMSTFNNGPSLNDVYEKLEELSAIIQEQCADQAVAETIEKGLRSFMQSAVSAATLASAPPIRLTMMWPTYLSDSLLSLIRRKVEPALAFLAYYCLVVHRSSSTAWFTHGWGARVADDIATHLANSPWAEVIQWPLEKIRESESAVGLENLTISGVFEG